MTVLVAKTPELPRAAPAAHRFSSASAVLLVGLLSQAVVPHRRRRGGDGDGEEVWDCYDGEGGEEGAGEEGRCCG